MSTRSRASFLLTLLLGVTFTMHLDAADLSSSSIPAQSPTRWRSTTLGVEGRRILTGSCPPLRLMNKLSCFR